MPALDVRNLSVRAADGTVILDDVSFAVARGSVVAIVGPTGAGKTTLLNALTGRLTVQSGSICIDGDDLAEDESVRRRLGYVPQDDVLHTQLSLRRTLEYAAALRLPTTVDATERAERVDAVLAELGLEGQSSLPVSSLSGGQRKRASIAVELLSRPDVLVLDEPTTGLDPGRERSVLATMRALADNGRTVLTVTHSPHALAGCDRVLFLAPGGRVAFFGPPEAAVAYFGHAHPADVFVALDHASAEEWKERFLAHPDHARYVSSPQTPEPAKIDPDTCAAADAAATPAADAPAALSAPAVPGWREQLRTLTRRYLALIRSDRRHVALLSVQGPILGLLLFLTLTRGSLGKLAATATPTLVAQHRADAVSVALFLALSVTWLGVANAVREIVKEHRIIVREEGTGLSLRAYVGAKALTLGALTMAQAAILTVIACARQGVPAHGAVLGSGYVEIVVATMLGALAAVALGLLLSALVTTPDKALTVLPMTLIAQLVFSGAWVPLTGPGLRQIRDLTSAHWTVHAVRSTVNGDPGDWWLSIFALLGLTAACIVATLALVQRRVLPTRIGEIRARLSSHLTPGLSGALVAVVALTVVGGVAEAAGSGSDFVPRPKQSVAGAPARPASPNEATAALPAPPLAVPDPAAAAAADAAHQAAVAEAAQHELEAKAAAAQAAAAKSAAAKAAQQQSALAAVQQAAQAPVATVAQLPAAVGGTVAGLSPAPNPTPPTTAPPAPTTPAPAPNNREPTLLGRLLNPLFGR